MLLKKCEADNPLPKPKRQATIMSGQLVGMIEADEVICLADEILCESQGNGIQCFQPAASQEGLHHNSHLQPAQEVQPHQNDQQPLLQMQPQQPIYQQPLCLDPDQNQFLTNFEDVWDVLQLGAEADGQLHGDSFQDLDLDVLAVETLKNNTPSRSGSSTGAMGTMMPNVAHPGSSIAAGGFPLANDIPQLPNLGTATPVVTLITNQIAQSDNYVVSIRDQSSPPNHVAQPSPQNNMACWRSPTNYVAQPSPPNNVASWLSPPNHVAQHSPQNNVAPFSPPNLLGQSSPQNNVAQSIPPNPGARFSPHNNVAGSSPLNDVVQPTPQTTVPWSSTPNHVARSSPQTNPTKLVAPMSTTHPAHSTTNVGTHGTDRVVKPTAIDKKTPKGSPANKKRSRPKASKTKCQTKSKSGEATNPPSLESIESKKAKTSHDYNIPDAKKLQLRFYQSHHQVIKSQYISSRNGCLVYHKKPCRFQEPDLDITSIDIPELGNVPQGVLTMKQMEATKDILNALNKGIHIFCDDKGNIFARRFCKSHVFCYSTEPDPGYELVVGHASNTTSVEQQHPGHYVQKLAQDKVVEVFNDDNFKVRLREAYMTKVVPPVPQITFTFSQPWEYGFPLSNCLVYMKVNPLKARTERSWLNHEDKSLECDNVALLTSMATLSLSSA